MARIKNQEAAGQKGTRDIASRFIRAGLPAPRQLVLDKRKDLNEFYIESKSQGVQ